MADSGDGDERRVLVPWIEALARARVGAAQVREKHLGDRALLELVRAAVSAARGRLRILVNGRPDLALAAGADGVHLPADGLPIEACRRLLGPGRLIGRSTHAPEEVERARQAGADYATFGPVFPTPSKADWEALPGLDGLRRACAAGLPVVALGGIRAEYLEAVSRAGAAGAAAIRALHDPDPLVEMAFRAHRIWPSSNSP